MLGDDIETSKEGQTEDTELDLRKFAQFVNAHFQFICALLRVHLHLIVRTKTVTTPVPTKCSEPPANLNCHEDKPFRPFSGT